MPCVGCGSCKEHAWLTYTRLPVGTSRRGDGGRLAACRHSQVIPPPLIEGGTGQVGASRHSQVITPPDGSDTTPPLMPIAV